MKQAVFIVGAARSGTTAMLKLLDLSNETVCEMEPEPNLNSESRGMWDGSLADPYNSLVGSVMCRIAKAFQRGDFYVEKQVSLVPFMKVLSELTGCKFIVMTRNGKDAVKSIINWHNRAFPVFYKECDSNTVDAIDSDGDDEMIDLFDFSLPRPLSKEEYSSRWFLMERLEMVSWYWSRVNRELFKRLAAIPEESFLTVDVADFSLETVAPPQTRPDRRPGIKP